MFPLEFRKMLDHITGIVHVKFPAAHVAVGKIYHEVYQKGAMLFQLHCLTSFFEVPGIPLEHSRATVPALLLRLQG